MSESGLLPQRAKVAEGRMRVRVRKVLNLSARTLTKGPQMS